jgi:hypothetical protein
MQRVQRTLQRGSVDAHRLLVSPGRHEEIRESPIVVGIWKPGSNSGPKLSF